MSDMDQLVMQALANSRLLQYPDKQLYRAATRLLPDERPTAPVRLSGPDETYLFKMQPRAEGFYNPPGNASEPEKKIVINRESRAYKSGDMDLLAAVIAHEAEHEKRYKNYSDNTGMEEGPAYKRQADVLRRLGHKDRAYIKAIDAEAKKREELETRALLAALKENK